MTETLTGLSPTTAWVLILLGTLAMLAGLVILTIARPHRAQVAQDTPTDPEIELGELPEPPTTVIPMIAPAHRRAGAYFTPHDGPLTPEPDEPYHHPGE